MDEENSFDNSLKNLEFAHFESLPQQLHVYEIFI